MSRQFPVSSFGPEMLTAILRGAREEYTLKFPAPNGYEQAVYFRQRAYLLRKSLRVEKHPQSDLAQRTCLPDPKRSPDGSAELRLYPKDKQFLGVLAAAGIQADPLPSDPLAELDRELGEISLSSEKSIDTNGKGG